MRWIVGVAREVFVKSFEGFEDIKGAFLSSWLSIKNGSCWSELKSSDMVHWVSRRRKDDDDRMDLEIEGGGGGGEGSERGLFSQRERNGYGNMKDKKSRSDDPRRNQATNGGKTTKNMKNTRNRWTKDRYKRAEQHMFNVMREKGAVFGKPILRAELRAEARKKVGDTGLLDHLLKHAAGKLAPGGEERFQRRYNVNGAMEYWLESADLMNITKEAGVQDPYWIPPPGDNRSQDPICAREIKELRKRVDKLERLVKELISKKQEDHSD